jgi:hypothetical protein
MAFPNNDLIEIEKSNALRAAARLPLLDVEAEIKRFAAVREMAEFEREWEKRRPEFAEWIGKGNGWLSKMGRWSVARQRVRKEMQIGTIDR